MNIPSINSDGIVPATKAKAPVVKAAPSRGAGDVYKPENNEKLLEIIRSEPAVRPEVVERARALAADANYPPSEALAQIARELLRQIPR